MSIHVKTGKVGRKEELNLAVCDCGPAFRLLFIRMPRCGGDKPAGMKKVGVKEEVWEDAHPGVWGLTHLPRVRAGVLRHPEGSHRELAVPDLRPRGSAKVSTLPEERGSAEAHPERDEMGPR